MTSGCLSLAGSNSCPEFTEFTAYIMPELTPVISDVATFDNYVKGAVSTNTKDPTAFGGGFVSTATQFGFGCSGWDGAGLRYHQSAVCAAFAAAGNSNGCQPATTIVPLCQQTMTVFVGSYRALISNSTVCPQPTAIAQNYVTFFSNAIPSLSVAETCLVAESLDSANCGFSTVLESQVYCATAKDNCCGTFIPTIVTESNSTSSIAPVAAPKSKVPLSSVSSGIDPVSEANPSQVPTLPDTILTPVTGPIITMNFLYGLFGGTSACLLVIFLIVFAGRIRRRNPIDDANSKEIQAHAEIEDYKSTKYETYTNTNVGNVTFEPATPLSLSRSNNTYTRPVSSGTDAHKVVHDYLPNMNDELIAHVSDVVIVKTTYDDGWGYGFNTRTMQEGFFPMGILAGFSGAGEDIEAIQKRKSSRYGMEPSDEALDEYKKLSPVISQHSFARSPVFSPQHMSPVPLPSVATPLAMVPRVPAVGPNKLRIVMYEFIPEISDEIELRVGDQIQVEEVFDDGWAVGKNLNTQKSGIFPMDTLVGYTKNDQSHKKRESSLYLTQETEYNADDDSPGGSRNY